MADPDLETGPDLVSDSGRMPSPPVLDPDPVFDPDPARDPDPVRDRLVAPPYRPRPVQWLGLVEVRGWRFKAYRILAPGRAADPDLLATAAAVVAAGLPADGPAIPAVGILILHQGEHANWLLVLRWVRGDSLAHRLYKAPLDAGHAFEDASSSGMIGCVWELGVVDAERRAWIETVMAGQPLDTYLARACVGTV